MDDFDAITDFFLWESEDPDRFAQSFCFLNTPFPRPIAGTGVGDVMQQLLAQIMADKGLRDLVDFQAVFHERYVFRGHRDVTVTGTQICLRRVKEEVPRLEDLTLAPFWGSVLGSETLCEGGLVVLASKPGSGKSTTIAGMVRSRLEQFGGFCKTVEAPPEFPLQNRWGQGVCFQIPVDERLPRSEQFSRPLRGLLRGYPTIPGGGRTILVVGETRDPETAAEVVSSSVGHLVITTMHALDVPSTVSRLCAMAGQVLGDSVARGMVADSLRVIGNQRLEVIDGGSGWKQVRAAGDMLYSRTSYSPVANMIREGNFTSLLGESLRQGRMFKAAAQRAADVDQILNEISPASAKKEDA